jgi:Holliday junction resolvasome RuvABC endonuclease subunit
MVLGLDISTSCTGWCVFGEKDKFVDMGYVSLPSKLDVFDKVGKIKDLINKLVIRYEINEIFIEENLQAFRPGFSSAKTLMTLARFNGIISYVCYDLLGIKPQYINVNSARKKIGLKIDRKLDKTTKEQILAWVTLDMSAYGYTYAWPQKTLKSGPRAGMTILHPGCYDSADAYVVCKASF